MQYAPAKEYPIVPVAKPRMTRRDKWKRRASVLRYYAFKDEVRLRKVELPQPCRVIFYLPMPASWPASKRSAMEDTAHRSKPDTDNLLKALNDSVFEDDAHLWSIWAEKRWSAKPRIVVMQILA